MRCLLFTVLLLTPLALKAKAPPSRLLVCLGSHEKEFHKKKAHGAFYDLNQRLISELLQTQAVDGSPALIGRVCKPGMRASVHVLEAMLLDPRGWYVLKPDASDLTKELLKEIIQETPQIFLNFLGALQTEAPTPDCLNRHIEGLADLNEEVKWLEDEIDINKITGKKTRLMKIFAGIQRSDEIFAVCAKELALLKEKSKKRDKAAGKPSAQ